MAEFKKLKCVYCGYEMATKSLKPRCGHCNSMRLNPINEFSVLKPFKKGAIPEKKIELKESAEVQTMAENKKNEDRKEEYIKPRAEEIEEDDKDILDEIFDD
jgi:hypothetical protein